MRIALLTLLLLTATTAAGDVLRIGINPFAPPMGYLDEYNQPTGFNIDIALALCERLDAECQLIPSTFAELIPGLQARRFDAVVASLSITEARRELVEFTDRYYTSPARFVAAREAAIDPANLNGRRIGVVRGTTSAAYLEANHADRATVVRYGYQNEALLDLQLGRLDLVLGDAIALRENFLRTEAGRNYRFSGPELDDPRWFGTGIGIAVQKGNDTLRQRFNQAIQALREDGTYLQIQDRYFDYDIYGPEDDRAARR